MFEIEISNLDIKRKTLGDWARFTIWSLMFLFLFNNNDDEENAVNEWGKTKNIELMSQLLMEM